MTIFTELASKHLLWFTKKVSQEGLDDNIHRTSFKTFTVMWFTKKVSQGLDDNIHRTSFKTLLWFTKKRRYPKKV